MSAEQVRLLVDIANVSFAVVSATPIALLLIAASLAMLRHPAFPAWLGWLGLLAALFNGILVQDRFVLPPAPPGSDVKKTREREPGPLFIQNHRSLISQHLGGREAKTASVVQG